MRKLLLIAVLTAGMCGLASAQEYKPGAGDFSLEVGFAPFGSNIINGGDLAGFIHFSDNVALRIGLSFGLHSETDDSGKTGSDLYILKKNRFDFGIEPGIVYSFNGTPRLAPYIGGGIYLGVLSTKTSVETNNKTTETTHPGGPDRYGDYFVFGVGAATGFNYYFAKNLYVGAEVNLAFKFTAFSNEKSTGDDMKDKVHDIDLGIGAQPLLRLGWTF